jgi:hypothetical protein
MARWTIASHRKFADFREHCLTHGVVNPPNKSAPNHRHSRASMPLSAVEGENPEPNNLNLLLLRGNQRTGRFQLAAAVPA